MFISKKKYEADLAAAAKKAYREAREEMWRNEQLNGLQTQINEIGEAVAALTEAVGKKRGLPILRRLGNAKNRVW